MASSTTALIFLRSLPLLRLSTARSAAVAVIACADLSRRHLSGLSSNDDSSPRPPFKLPETTPPTKLPGTDTPPTKLTVTPPTKLTMTPPTRLLPDLCDANDPEFRRWKKKEAEILKDVEPIMWLAKEILHSNRYRDGEKLIREDEKIIVEKLLAYHPHARDKIGCGFGGIMVDKHPDFAKTRCLFVVRTDGAWIDFSYQKCLLSYVRKKYPFHAKRFIKEHLKRKEHFSRRSK